MAMMSISGVLACKWIQLYKVWFIGFTWMDWGHMLDGDIYITMNSPKVLCVCKTMYKVDLQASFV